MTWHNERKRHSLAAKGIRTTRRMRTEDAFYKQFQGELPLSHTKEQGNLERIFYIGTMWKRGEGGKRDNRTRANTVLPLTIEDYDYWDKNKERIDLEDIDTPRRDVNEVKIGDNTIYVGGDNFVERSRNERVLRKALEHFTKEEINDLDNLFIDCSDSFKEYTDCIDYAYNTPFEYNGNKGNAILLNEEETSHKELEVHMVHELVHALHWVRDQKSNDVETEEKKTELETMARVDTSKVSIGGTGYYATAKSNTEEENIEGMFQDKEALSGDIKKISKGKRLTDKVDEYYDKSYIKKQKLNLSEEV